MTVLGILSTTSALKMAKVTGTRETPKWVTFSDTLKFPEAPEDGALLASLGKSTLALLADNPPDHITLLKVVGSQHNHSLEIRVKVEGLLQMLGARLGIPTQLVAPVALRNLEKKFDIFTGGSPEGCLNGGKKFKSADLRSAVLTAWYGLPEE
jgi:hypothetical protein